MCIPEDPSQFLYDFLGRFLIPTCFNDYSLVSWLISPSISHPNRGIHHAFSGVDLRNGIVDVSSRFIPCRCLLSRTTRKELSKPYGAEIFTLVLAIGQVKKVSADTVLCLSDTNMRRGSTTDNWVCLVC
jgi:hypothetical protein